MTPQQRAVIAAAQKDGLEPMEIAAELLCHDLMACMLDQLRKRQVAFAKLSEQEQDAAIADIQVEVKKAATTAARVITAQGKEIVGAKLKSLKIDGKLTATMIIEGDEPNRHILTDKAHDKSDILIVLYPNSYAEGLSAHRGEKDQKEIELDDSAPASTKKAEKKEPRPTSAAAIAAKPVVIPPKLLADAIEFIAKQQVCGASSLQNHLKIGHPKAVAIQAELAEKGILSVDEKGEYQIVRTGSGAAPEAGIDVPAISDEMFEKIKAKVIADGRATVSGTAVFFDIEEVQAYDAIEELIIDGLLSTENAGVYEVLAQPA